MVDVLGNLNAAASRIEARQERRDLFHACLCQHTQRRVVGSVFDLGQAHRRARLGMACELIPQAHDQRRHEPIRRIDVCEGRQLAAPQPLHLRDG